MPWGSSTLRAAAPAVALLCAGAILLMPSPALAHRDPTVTVSLTGVRPSLPDSVEMAIVEGELTEIGVSNSTQTPFVAMDPSEHPFLEISASGVVGDVTSPYLRPTVGAVQGARPVPGHTSGRWMRLSTHGVWAWPDPRVDPGRLGSDILPGSHVSWSMEFRYGVHTYEGSGQIERIRLPGRLRAVVQRAPDGVQASVIDGKPPMLRIVVPAHAAVVVLGENHRPFLRSSAAGFLIRSDSLEYRTELQATGMGPAQDAGWVPFAPGTKVAWADRRLQFDGAQVPRYEASSPVVVGRWSVPVRIDGRAGEIAGVIELEPPDSPISPQTGSGRGGTGSGPWWWLLLAVAVTVAWVLRARSTRRASVPGHALKEVPDGQHHVAH